MFLVENKSFIFDNNKVCKKTVFKRFLLILLLILGVAHAYAKEQIVFVINTQEDDDDGGAIPHEPYIQENEYIKDWKKIYPQATIVRIRAKTTNELTKNLDLWMQPNPSQKEVAGIFINSHGNKMYLASNDVEFNLLMPDNLATFAPLFGHYAKGVRVVFNSCLILSDMTPAQAKTNLAAILDGLKIQNGSIYANATKGDEPFRNLKNTDVIDKNMTLGRTLEAIAFYTFLPLSAPGLYVYEKHIANQGFFLERDSQSSRLYKTDYFSALQPTLSIQKNTQPISFDNKSSSDSATTVSKPPLMGDK